MTNISDNIKQIKETITEDVLLVAVTKTRSPEEINRAIEAGITDIGENRVQEIIDKYDKVASVRWHMIGHLQTNKVKYIIDKICLIHSVDSLKLAKEIDRRASECGIAMDILVQVNAAGEESKFGLGMKEADQLAWEILDQCPNLRVRGLMSIVPFEDDPESVRVYFQMVKELFETLKKRNHPRLDLKWLSMGMSNDYTVAIEEGSNLVRIGTAIFGER
jgi:hypothetical protein